MNKTLTVAFPGDKRVSVEMDGMTVHTDQPVKEGGLGETPTPFGLFLASLATCAAHYARSFCDTRKLSTKGLGLAMHLGFDEKVKRYTTVRFELTLPEDFPDKYRAPIMRAVEACYVKKHLENPPAFTTEIKG